MVAAAGECPGARVVELGAWWEVGVRPGEVPGPLRPEAGLQTWGVERGAGT